MNPMKFPKYAFFLVLLAGAAFLTAADKPVPSAWFSALPAIDGADSEWGAVAPVDVEDGHIGCAFANDAKNLYVLLVIKNPQYKSTIEQTGVTMYFNADGKKKTRYGILFNKIMIKPDEYIAMLEKQGPLTDEQKAAGIANEQMTQESMRNNIIGSTGGKTPKKYTFWSLIKLAAEPK